MSAFGDKADINARPAWTAGNVVFPVFERVTEKAVEQFLSLRRKIHPGGREVAISGLIHLCTPTYAGVAEMMSYEGIGVFYGAPGGPVYGPGGSGNERPQLGDTWKPQNEDERQWIERRDQRRVEARKTQGEEPPKRYRGFLW
jgi:hypothetical protein